MEKIDFSRPIELMDGTECGVVSATLQRICFPVGGKWHSAKIDEDGCIGGVQVVRNGPESVKRMLSGWVGVYEPGDGCAHSTKEIADMLARAFRIADICIEKEYTEGEGL